ncbi:MAG: DNA repair protein RadC [Elusimicrobiota bacterium]
MMPGGEALSADGRCRLRGYPGAPAPEIAGLRVADLHPVERPRERLFERGPRALRDEELLAVVLRTGYAGCGVLDLARGLLRRYPDGTLGRLPVRELSRQKGVGRSRAAVLAAALELGRRWESRGSDEGPLLDSPQRVWLELSALRGKRKEYFVAFYLDACNRLAHRETVSIGTLTASLVHPREVFGPAIERSAAGVIIAHNHPSGNPKPSGEDRETTRRLAQAGRILGIPLLDHVVVTDCRYFSFREQGLMEE